MIAPEALADQVLKAPYHRIFVRENSGSGYSASVLELQGVFGAGLTVEEANQTLEEAMVDWVSFEHERGNLIPEPLDIDAYGGRVSLRLPPSLHYAAVVRAHVEGVSINRLLSDAVAQHVGAPMPRLDVKGLASAVVAQLESLLMPMLVELDEVVSRRTAGGWVAFSVKDASPSKAFTTSSFPGQLTPVWGQQIGASHA